MNSNDRHPLLAGPGLSDRDRYWRKRLRRFQFDAEPLAVQLDRNRQMTVFLSWICVGIAAIFLLIFTAFLRPDVGAIVDLILFVPLLSIAWADHALLARRLAAYEREASVG